MHEYFIYLVVYTLVWFYYVINIIVHYFLSWASMYLWLSFCIAIESTSFVFQCK